MNLCVPSVSEVGGGVLCTSAVCSGAVQLGHVVILFSVFQDNATHISIVATSVYTSSNNDRHSN